MGPPLCAAAAEGKPRSGSPGFLDGGHATPDREEARDQIGPKPERGTSLSVLSDWWLSAAVCALRWDPGVGSVEPRATANEAGLIGPMLASRARNAHVDGGHRPSEFVLIAPTKLAKTLPDTTEQILGHVAGFW